MHSFPKSLLDGYANFMSGKYQKIRGQYHELADKGQKPDTMIISCCDSRSAPETIFGTGPGELFVVRNVANLVPPFCPDDGGLHGTSAALEFAVQALKIKNIIVMGHGRCGGITASLTPDMEPLAPGNFIGKWMEMLEPVAQEANKNISLTKEERQTAVERISIRNSVTNLRSFPYIAQKESANKLTLYGAWFDIKTGELWVMDNKSGNFERVKV